MSVAAVEQVLQLVSSLAGELRAGGEWLPLAQLDDNLERDLGFDSLERAELVRRLEKIFDVQLPPRTLATAQTPRDLWQAVAGESAVAAFASSGSGSAHVAPPIGGDRRREELVVGQRVGVHVGDVLYAAYAWALLFMLGLGALAAVVILPRLAWRRQVAHIIARAFVAGAGVPIHVSGKDHFPPQGPTIVVANHSSYLDAIVLTKVLPTPCNFVAKRELARYPVTRLLLGRIGTSFVERVDAEASVVAAQEIAALAKRGESFLFFAEGTFTREPGLRSFRMGAFVAAASAGTPVVPVAIRGTRAVLPEGRWLPRRGRIVITASAPIIPDGTDWAAAVRLRDRTRAAILAGCGEDDLAGVRR